MAKSKTVRDSPGFVEPGVLYLAEEARHRLNMGTWAWRKARRAGLQVVYLGRDAYVFGDDLLAFFRGVRSSQAVKEHAE